MEEQANVRSRAPVSKEVQLQVFRRDGWMCRWCGRPVVFAPAMKYLERLVRGHGFTGALAYHDERWRRDRSPLLDYLGAVIDHVEAHSRGGAAAADNFVTSCNKCSTRKSNAPAGDFTRRLPAHIVKGKYGEPRDWDGLTAVFIVLVDEAKRSATASELSWLRGPERHHQDTPQRLRAEAWSSPGLVLARHVIGKSVLLAPVRSPSRSQATWEPRRNAGPFAGRDGEAVPVGSAVLAT